MQIEAKILKALLRQLGAVKAEQFTLDTENGRAVARDQEIEVIVQSPALKAADLFERHSLTVNLRRLSAVTSKMTGVIELIPNARSLSVAGGRGSAELEVFSGKPYTVPAFATLQDARFLPLSTLLGLLRFAMVAAEPNRASPSGGIVELRTIDSLDFLHYQVAATDQNRLHLARAEAYAPCPLMHVPLCVVGALGGISADEVEIASTESSMLFRTQKDDVVTILRAEKLAKQMPSYERIQPKKFDLSCSIDPVDLKSALESVAPMVGEEASGRDDGGAVELKFKGGTLAIRSYGAQNKATADVAYVELLANSPVYTYSLKLQSMLDFLGFAKDKVVFDGNGPQEMMSFRSGDYTMLVAPTIVPA